MDDVTVDCQSTNLGQILKRLDLCLNQKLAAPHNGTRRHQNLLPPYGNIAPSGRYRTIERDPALVLVTLQGKQSRST
jgi:hypothetical protein